MGTKESLSLFINSTRYNTGLTGSNYNDDEKKMVDGRDGERSKWANNVETLLLSNVT